MPDIFELKFEAHGLIDELVMLGVSRNRVYKNLRYRLRVQNGYEHLARMSTMSQVESAIIQLKSMLRSRRRVLNKEIVKSARKVIENSSNKQKEATVLPLKEQKRLLAELKQPRKPRHPFTNWLRGRLTTWTWMRTKTSLLESVGRF